MLTCDSLTEAAIDDENHDQFQQVPIRLRNTVARGHLSRPDKSPVNRKKLLFVGSLILVLRQILKKPGRLPDSHCKVHLAQLSYV